MTDSDGFGITVCNCPEVITSEVNGTVHIVCGGKIGYKKG